jgi:hypothetical protein
VAVRIAAFYLTALIFFSWGAAVARYEVFPFDYIKSVKDNVAGFVRGDIEEDTTVLQKLKNDFNVTPERFVRHYKASSSDEFREVGLEGRRDRRETPRIWVSPSAPDSYRLIVGVLDFEKAFWGAILLDPDGRVVHRWHMNNASDLTDQSDVLMNLYGVAFFPDGSAVFNKQERSGGLVKIDYCSKLEWTKSGTFHHVAEPTEDSSAFWTFGGRQSQLHPTLVLVDAATGDTIKEIDMADVEKANPDTFIFDLRRRNGVGNATHPNHIEPLPAALADAYPQFSAGDLVLSYQATNLIFVLDPDSLKIKWWYLGGGDGQHDPDWHDDGTISVFNNNYRAKRHGMPEVSSIVSIDPKTNTHYTVVSGKLFNFWSEKNSNHQFTGDGTVIITSALQGRVLEVDLRTGEKVLEFVNAYDWDNGLTLHLSETFVIDDELAKQWTSRDCSADPVAQGRERRDHL